MVRRLVVVACLALALPQSAAAQGGGGFGGGGFFVNQGTRNSNAVHDLDFYGPPQLPTDAALNYITVDGTVESRIAPEEVRVVLAVTVEADDAASCQRQVAETISKVRQAWREQPIRDDNVVEDFINVLPRYEWRIVERDGQQVRLQQRSGFRMQTNLHVSVKTEAEAMNAINRAFQNGVTDIVTFDYWSSRLDEQKRKARIQAVAEAKEKADALLSVFDKRPPVINVQESTQVFFPRTLYKTYENVLEEQTEDWNSWRDKPMIKAYRPKMTFFHGVQTQADVRPRNVVMQPEIAVVSTVRIYYQSPAEMSRTVKQR